MRTLKPNFNGDSCDFKKIVPCLVVMVMIAFTHHAFAQGSTLRAPIVLGDSPIMSELMNDLAPNVLMLYDNSVSMQRSFTPDSLRQTDPGPGYYIQFGYGGDSAANKNNRTLYKLDDPWYMPASVIADNEEVRRLYPPMLSAAFNRQAYDPTVTYYPPQVVGGKASLPTWARALVPDTSATVATYPEMSSENTSQWTKVPGSVEGSKYWTNSPSMTNLKYQAAHQSTRILSPEQRTPNVGRVYFDARGTNKNFRVWKNETRTRIYKKYFPDIEDPEVSELFTFYCDNDKKLYRDYTDNNLEKLAGLTWSGCSWYYLPLHYFKTSVKWCSKQNPTTNFWPGRIKADEFGFGDGGSDCVDLNDASYDSSKHKYPYFHYPFGDRVTPSKYDNTKYNPFIPVILDLEDPSRIYTHHYINDKGELGTFTRTFEEEMTNYLNWLVYYSTRERAAKTIISRVFKDVSPYTHVGIARLTALTGTPIDQYGKNKGDFYKSLFAMDTGGSTPMLAAVERVGNYFMKKPSATGNCSEFDCPPMKYGCQRNNVIMFTDGVWNDWLSVNATTRQNYDDKLTANLPDSSVEIYGENLVKNDQWPRPIYHGANASTYQSLADRTLRYWMTDIRPDFYQENGGKYLVPPTPNDPATWPHITFSALAFGVQGEFPVADKNLVIQQLINGTKNWPAVNSKGTGTYGYMADPRADDLWHATINGFGTYLSSQTPAEFENNLRALLREITTVGGTEANAAFENANLNKSVYAYVPSYKPGWSGDLKKVEVDPETQKQKSGYVWSASEELKILLKSTALAPEPWMTERKIITLRHAGDGVGKQQIDFLYEQLNEDQLLALGSTKDGQEKMIAYLRGDSRNEGSGAGKFRARTGPLGDIVNSEPVYVGSPNWDYDETLNPGYDDFKNAHKNRDGVIYVGANDGMLHAFDADTGRELWAYIPSNLFRSAESGGLAALASRSWTGNISTDDAELPEEYLRAQSCEDNERDQQGYCSGWAPTCPDHVKDSDGFCPGFGPGDVPSKSCDDSEKDTYGNCPPIDLGEAGESIIGDMFYHRYYVDATPRVMDARVGDGDNPPWRTVLVSGLGKGGTSYFAIDVTDPHNPEVLWEFTDKNMGYTYGRAIIAKTMAHGQNWVALMPSGYNNGTGKGQPKNGDGIARLHVANLIQGLPYSDQDLQSLLDPEAIKVVAGHGTRNWPAGMGHIVGFVDSQKDQTVKTVYGGDQRGMLWRFRIDNSNIRNWAGSKLGYHLRDPSRNWQPVSTEPTVAVDEFDRRWVFVGTGRLTSAADLNSKISNTMYAYIDGSKEKSREAYDFVNRDPTYMKNIEVIKSYPRPGGGNNGRDRGGWYHDLPDKYHVIVNPVVFNGVLAYVATTYGDTVQQWDCDESSARSIIYMRRVADGSLMHEIDVKGGVTGLTLLVNTTGDEPNLQSQIYLGVVVNGEVTLIDTKDVFAGTHAHLDGVARRNFMRVLE